MGEPIGILNIFGLVLDYLIALTFTIFVIVGIGQKNTLRSTNRIVDDFFNYIAKGRRRVPLYANTTRWLVFIILVPFHVLWLLIWAATGSVFAGFLLSAASCFVLFRWIAKSKDRMKRSRHNGIAIGYEYMHPAGKEDAMLDANGEKAGRTIAYGGSKGVYDISLKSEPSPHMMIVGKTGEGKSTTMRTMLSRGYAKYEIPFLIIDWSGSYRKLGEMTNLWIVPRNLRVNPLLLRGMKGERRSGIASETLQFALDLTNLQAQKIRELLAELYEQGTEPTIQMLYEKVRESIELERFKDIKVQNQYIANKLRQTFEVFGEEPKGFWENYDKVCNVVELEGLTEAEKGLVTYSMLRRITEEFKDEGGVKLLIALDDAYRAVNTQYGRETPIARIVREGRKYGFGLVIATQMLADLPDAVIANTSVKMVHPNHGPEDVARIHKILHLSDVEKEIMRRMPVGHCFILDEHALQKGRAHSAYVEIDNLRYEEIKSLLVRSPKLEIAEAKGNGEHPMKTQGIIELLKKEGIEIPSATLYRFLIALKKEGNQQGAYRMLKEKGWITSPTTMYGTKSKPSLLERAKNCGYLDQNNAFTVKAAEIINPDRLIARQKSNAGSLEHTEMMAKTIRSVQENGNFAFVLAQQDSFDVGEVQVDQKSKYLWDYVNLKTYEIQTNAIDSEIRKCMEKAGRFNAEMKFVTNNQKVAEEIRRITNDKHGCNIL